MWEITGATQFTLSVTQAAGGTDFIQKVLEGFGVPSVKSVFMVDMNAYDGFAAMSTIEDLCEKGCSTSCCQLIFQTNSFLQTPQHIPTAHGHRNSFRLIGIGSISRKQFRGDLQGQDGLVCILVHRSFGVRLDDSCGKPSARTLPLQCSEPPWFSRLQSHCPIPQGEPCARPAEVI